MEWGEFLSDASKVAKEWGLIEDSEKTGAAAKQYSDAKSSDGNAHPVVASGTDANGATVLIKQSPIPNWLLIGGGVLLVVLLLIALIFALK